MNREQPILAIKIDVDTERGTRIGVPNLIALLQKHKIAASFFFSFGKDNTGRAIKRIFRRGFLEKVKRTSVVSTYGLRTLLNGVLLPGPHIGKKHAALLQSVAAHGFDIGIHCNDHILWQDGVATMSEVEIEDEFAKALFEFERIFARKAISAAAPGWQANAKTFAVYDNADLLYGSDTRGREPFFPRVADRVFNVLQIPTTLPTLDELIGFDRPLMSLIAYYSSQLSWEHPNILTIHAELEGMKYLEWFGEFLLVLQKRGVQFWDLNMVAQEALKNRDKIPVSDVFQGSVSGRSGSLACQAL